MAVTIRELFKVLLLAVCFLVLTLILVGDNKYFPSATVNVTKTGDEPERNKVALAKAKRMILLQTRRNTTGMETTPLEAAPDVRPMGRRPQPILTLFTTFSKNEAKMPIFANTLKIWPLLKPFIYPIVYCPDAACQSRWNKSAQASGWAVHQALSNSKDNIPVLRYMYIDAISRYNSTFYAYANGDILFDQSIAKTLKFLEKYANTGENLLIVGRRSNYKMTKGKHFSTFNEVKEAKKKSTLFTTLGEDYFIYTENAVDWTQVPDVVVGQFNYLLISSKVNSHSNSQRRINTTLDALTYVQCLHFFYFDLV